MLRRVEAFMRIRAVFVKVIVESTVVFVGIARAGEAHIRIQPPSDNVDALAGFFHVIEKTLKNFLAAGQNLDGIAGLDAEVDMGTLVRL